MFTRAVYRADNLFYRDYYSAVYRAAVGHFHD
jgi:hypothetical protein